MAKKSSGLCFFISLALCSVSTVIHVWSIAMDVQEGDWQSLMDTVPCWAACFTGMVGFNVFVGLVSLASQRVRAGRWRCVGCAISATGYLLYGNIIFSEMLWITYQHINK